MKGEITFCSDFENRLRHTFAPKKPAYAVHVDIFATSQKANIPMETFFTRKRALLGQLPQNSHTEAQQLDIYGLLTSTDDHDDGHYC